MVSIENQSPASIISSVGYLNGNGPVTSGGIMKRWLLFLLIFGAVNSTGFAETEIIFAHRGYSEIYPENTMLAFEKAIEAGVNGVELDVQRSSDGVIVVMHDTTLERTTDSSGPVESASWSQLSALDAGHGTPFSGRHDTRVPRLDEVLDYFKNRPEIFLIVELKGENNIGAEVANLIAGRQMENQAWVEATDPLFLDAARTAAPEITTLLQETLPEVLSAAVSGRYSAISVDHTVYSGNPQFQRDTEAAGLFASVFTTDTDDEIKAAIKSGARAITTNLVGAAAELAAAVGLDLKKPAAIEKSER